MSAVPAWIVLAIVVVLVLLLSTVIVKTLSDPHEAHPLSTVVAIGSLSTVLLCVLALPVDVYLVSSAVDYATGVRVVSAETVAQRASEMQTVYNALYIALLAFSFVLIPFAYFYYEEDEEGATVGQKIVGALKFTLGFVISFSVLIVIGLLMRPNPGKSDDTAEWVKSLLDTSNRGQGAIFFTIACVMLLGTPGFVIYAGYGLAAWPIGLLKGNRSLSLERQDVVSELDLVKAKTEAIKYKRKQNKKDRTELDRLLKKERLLQQHTTVLDREAESWVARLKRLLRPFSFLLGALGYLVSVFIVTALVLSTIDRAKNSTCGMECGWTLDKPRIPNPLDIALVQAHKVFPMDYAVFAGILVFFFFATLAGIAKIGVRFAWVLIYRIRTRRTVPQGILLTAMVLNFLILTLSMQILTLAPQYATFGYQSYVVAPGGSGNGTGGGNGTADAYGAAAHFSASNYASDAAAARALEGHADTVSTDANPDAGLASISHLAAPRIHGTPAAAAPAHEASGGGDEDYLYRGNDDDTDIEDSTVAEIEGVLDSSDGDSDSGSGSVSGPGSPRRTARRAVRHVPRSAVAAQADVLVSDTVRAAGTAAAPNPGVKPCRRDSPAGACQTTRLAHLISQVSTQMPFFGIVFYYQNWAFIGMFFLGTIIAAFRARPGATDDLDSDGEDMDMF